MSVRPSPKIKEASGLRLLKGRGLKRPAVAPWMIMALIAVTGFLGLGFVRTSLDRLAFDLAELDRAITEQTTLNRGLRVQLAQLESPVRIAPLAEELGLVLPRETIQVLVDLAPPAQAVAQSDTGESNQ